MIKEIFKSFGGIIFFFIFQIIYSILISFINIDNFIIQNILLLGGELILAIIFGYINRKRLIHDYNDFNNNYKEYLKVGIKYWIIGLIFMVASNLAINIYIESGVSANEEANRTALQMYPIYSIIAISLLAPFVEELVFRSDFKDLFKKRSSFIIITSLLFAGAHIITGISDITNIIYIIPYFCLSLSLALSYYDTNNIFTTITIHTFHNTLSAILLVLLYSGV